MQGRTADKDAFNERSGYYQGPAGGSPKTLLAPKIGAKASSPRPANRGHDARAARILQRRCLMLVLVPGIAKAEVRSASDVVTSVRAADELGLVHGDFTLHPAGISAAREHECRMDIGAINKRFIKNIGLQSEMENWKFWNPCSGDSFIWFISSQCLKCLSYQN